MFHQDQTATVLWTAWTANTAAWTVDSTTSPITTAWPDYDTGTSTTGPTTWMDWTGRYRLYGNWGPQYPRTNILDIIRSRLSPAIHTTRKGAGHPPTLAEQRARETLAVVVGRREYRRFLKHGFVCIRNRNSGRIYQIRPGQGMTHVYLAGKCIAKLCVVLPRKYPPTDSIIVRALMAWNNEDELWRLANRYQPNKIQSSPRRTDQRPLPEIYRELRSARYVDFDPRTI